MKVNVRERTDESIGARYRDSMRMPLKIRMPLNKAAGSQQMSLRLCPYCRTNMNLAARQPVDDRYEALFFNCPLCAKVEEIEAVRS
jgi:hypothetical protein